MKFKNILSFFLSLALMLCFTSCREAENTGSTFENQKIDENSIRDYITLLYSAADGFNPYTVKTEINRNLCKLIYEPLVKLDNEFNPVLSIAQNISLDGINCTVNIKKVEFSDGTVVTADDVVYSFNLAKNSQSAYSSRLYNIASASATGSTTVVFTLLKADPYTANLLTFPILKNGSDKITDSDSVLQPPVGSGRFKVNGSHDGLVLNTESFTQKSTIKAVRLINAPDIESVTHYAQIGAADLYYSDISDGNITRLGGKKTDINLNSLVYIGINQNYGALSENLLRQALSTGIDRTKLCQNAYYNNAIAATGFFNPVWKEVKSVQNIQITANREITVENLEKIGYNNLDSDGNRINSNKIPLRFSLLVNAENRMRVVLAGLIAEQLKDYGISITVIEKPYAQYIEALNNGEFQLFIGEVKLTENMDFSPLLLKDGALAFGLPKNTNQVEEASSQETSKIVDEFEVVTGFYNGTNTITDIAAVLQSKMPFIPICYRTGALFYNDNIENVSGSSESDIYFSVESYICNS